jgi:hypothetical protein
MTWIKTQSGDWLNLERCESITVWSENDKFKVKIKIGNDDYVWKKFDTEVDAKNFLNTEMYAITGV